MAPPRLQCLNATRQVASLTSKATFSTSSAARADDTRRSAASSLLETLSSDIAKPKNNYSPYQDPSSPRVPGAASRNSWTNSNKIGAQNPAILSLLRPHGRQHNTPTLDTRYDAETQRKAVDLSKQISRRWKAGDVYAPHDLSPAEMAKWKKRERPNRDVFDVLDFNPKEHYTNFSIMSEYMTPMGRIKHSSETGLRPVNQRRIARAIRRSIGIGMMPSVYKHPEVITASAARSNQSNSAVRNGPGAAAYAKF